MCRAPSVATSEGWLPVLEREYPRSIPRAIAAALPGTPVRRASRWNRTLFFHLGPSLTRSSVFSSSSNSKGNEGRCTPLWQNFSRVRRLIIPIHPHPRGTRLTSRRATRAPPTLNITRMASPRVSSARSALTPSSPFVPRHLSACPPQTAPRNAPTFARTTSNVFTTARRSGDPTRSWSSAPRRSTRRLRFSRSKFGNRCLTRVGQQWRKRSEA